MAQSALPPTTNPVMKAAKGGSERNVLGAGSVAHRLELLKREKNDSFIEEVDQFRAVSPNTAGPTITVTKKDMHRAPASEQKKSHQRAREAQLNHTAHLFTSGEGNTTPGARIEKRLLPATESEYEGHTRRIEFKRRDEARNFNVVVLCFEGVVGDVSKTKIDALTPVVSLRSGAYTAMKQLVKKFQLVLVL